MQALFDVSRFTKMKYDIIVDNHPLVGKFLQGDFRYPPNRGVESSNANGTQRHPDRSDVGGSSSGPKCSRQAFGVCYSESLIQ
jgi:hypothetical protein